MTSPTADREILISRLFNAPRELAWQAMTDPRHIVHWWGPIGFTTTIQEMDVRPGGTWTLTMHAPDGANFANYSVFDEVVYPERLVFTQGGHQEGGGHPEIDFIATWTFTTEGTQTRVTIHMVFPTAAKRDLVANEYGAIEGAKQTLERLSEHLPAMGHDARYLELERIFDAPAALVFQCWTDPAHLQRWWGPAGFTNPVCKTDPRPGGTWQIVMRAPDGTNYPCEGEYLEIVPNQRLVFTNNATGDAGRHVLNGLTIVTFSEQNGQTKMTIRTSAIAAIPEAIRYLAGMTEGWTQSLHRLNAEITAHA